MIGSIILIVIVAGAITYLAKGVQKNKKVNAVVESIESKVEELEPKLKAAVEVVEAKVKELKPKAAKPKATQAAKPKVTVTKQKTK